MIELIAQATSPASGSSTGASGAGPYTSLVFAVTVSMTAISLILVQVLRGWKKWKPVGEFFPNASIRFAALFSAAAMVLAFFFLRTPDTVKTLTGTLVIAAVGALISLMVYNILFSWRVFKQMQGLDKDGNLVTIDIVGGFLNRASKEKLAADPNLIEQDLVDACNGKLDRVWWKPSRGIVAALFLLVFVLLVTFAALTATAIGLFTLIASGVIPASSQVRVPATVMLSEPVRTSDISVGNNGFIKIPAGQRAVLVSAATQKWTGDQLDNIERLLSKRGEPYTVDVTRLVAAYNAAPGDVDAFVKWMRAEFDVLVDEKITSPTATSGFPLFESLAESYVRENVFSDIADPSKRSGNQFKVDLYSESSRSTIPVPLTVRRAVWKRIVCVALRDSESLEPILGPYYDVTSKGVPSPGVAGPGSPSPNSSWGSLVGGIMTPDADARTSSVKLGAATPFSRPSDAIGNPTNVDAIARLGMNDRIPYDNGDGYAEVIYRVEKIPNQ
ncbi:MAG: hypothetical protein H7144_15815 [Burkholderiales bacterium]|nr:hypothetical protein [Phycisphaerae bacterium]